MTLDFVHVKRLDVAFNLSNSRETCLRASERWLLSRRHCMSAAAAAWVAGSGAGGDMTGTLVAPSGTRAAARAASAAGTSLASAMSWH